MDAESDISKQAELTSTRGGRLQKLNEVKLQCAPEEAVVEVQSRSTVQYMDFGDVRMDYSDRVCHCILTDTFVVVDLRVKRPRERKDNAGAQVLKWKEEVLLKSKAAVALHPVLRGLMAMIAVL